MLIKTDEEGRKVKYRGCLEIGCTQSKVVGGKIRVEKFQLLLAKSKGSASLIALKGKHFRSFSNKKHKNAHSLSFFKLFKLGKGQNRGNELKTEENNPNNSQK